MVNKERVRKLVDALRSGDYKQGNGRLTIVQDDGQELDCCLGVATKVAMADGVVLERRMPLYRYTCRAVGYCTSSISILEYLPPTVRDYYGFTEEDPILRLVTDNLTITARASELNDYNKLPFDTIALAFEQTFLTEEGE